MKAINRIYIQHKTFDSTNEEELGKAYDFAVKNPSWKLVTTSFDGCEWLFERKKEIQIPYNQIVNGQIYSNEIDEWVDVDEYIDNQVNEGVIM